MIISPVLLNKSCVSGAITQPSFEIVSRNVGNVNTSKSKKFKKCKKIHFPPINRPKIRFVSI